MHGRQPSVKQLEQLATRRNFSSFSSTYYFSVLQSGTVALVSRLIDIGDVHQIETAARWLVLSRRSRSIIFATKSETGSFRLTMQVASRLLSHRLLSAALRSLRSIAFLSLEKQANRRFFAPSSFVVCFN